MTTGKEKLVRIATKMNKLPSRLNKEPLVDAIFELRFSSETPATNLLPGFFFGKLECERHIEHLPAMQIPTQVRESDQNLQFTPLLKIKWKTFTISIGDKVIVLGCGLPYPGWSVFKEAILDVMKVTSELGLLQSVVRYSLKYVDLVPSLSIAEQIDDIALELKMGSYELISDRFNIRLDLQRDGVLHIVNIVASAQAQLSNGKAIEGLVVDTDSIVNANDVTFADWMGSSEALLDSLHQSNKQTFFDILSEKAIEKLEPEYD